MSISFHSHSLSLSLSRRRWRNPDYTVRYIWYKYIIDMQVAIGIVTQPPAYTTEDNNSNMRKRNKTHTHPKPAVLVMQHIVWKWHFDSRQVNNIGTCVATRVWTGALKTYGGPNCEGGSRGAPVVINEIISEILDSNYFLVKFCISYIGICGMMWYAVLHLYKVEWVIPKMLAIFV